MPVHLSPRLGDFNDDLRANGSDALRAHLRPQLAPEDAVTLPRSRHRLIGIGRQPASASAISATPSGLPRAGKTEQSPDGPATAMAVLRCASVPPHRAGADGDP